MNRITFVSAGLGLVGLLSLTAVGEAQHEQGHPMIKEGAPTDSRQDDRVALGLSQEAEAGMKLTMREHLEALQAIVAGLGRQEFEQAAKVAHEELGFPKHHQAMQREGVATFPLKYHELAMAHHQEAESLAKVLPSKDLKTILPQLERTIGVCVSCHRAYKL
ncbi:MAG: cytochrome c [Nitrospirae bacterium]|nr:cytochrome c [Nitrospirota bacterium]